MLSMVPVARDSGATPGPAELAICTRGLSKHYRHPWTLRVTRGLDGLFHNNGLFQFRGLSAASAESDQTPS